jgi:diguanylate cyclase (GGDEF)-like protein
MPEPVPGAPSPARLADLVFSLAALGLLHRPPREAVAAARFTGISMLLMAAISVATRPTLAAWGPRLSAAGLEQLQVVLTIPLALVTVAMAMGALWMEVREAQARLERIAYFDELTGLPNRRATLERFEAELARTRRRDEELALVLLDVDRFKRVNDERGHQVGDVVLREVASRLAEGARTEDIVGRIGGEEFAVILGGGSSRTAIAETADRLRREVSRWEIAGVDPPLKVTVSGGYSLYPDDGTSWDELFARADERLYRAKQSGRDRVVGPDAPASVRA